MNVPLILVSNDDGIESDGLWAAAEAVLPLGDVVVVAPDRQWSGGGRSMPREVTGRIREVCREIGGDRVQGYAVDASPALAVDHAILELTPRRPALVVSGINFGANLGTSVTISGTVGAALEAAAFGIPALAVSQEMEPQQHLVRNSDADFEASKAFVHHFASMLLMDRMSHDVDVLNINVPASATTETAWRMTHLSRQRYFLPVRPDRGNGEGRPGFQLVENVGDSEPRSDMHAVLVDRVVSVTPLSLDLTSRVEMQRADRRLPQFRQETRPAGPPSDTCRSALRQEDAGRRRSPYGSVGAVREPAGGLMREQSVRGRRPSPPWRTQIISKLLTKR